MDLTTLLIFGLMLIIPTIAQIGIKTSYAKYLKIASKQGLSGQEVARKILDKNGLDKLHVVETEGTLSDHYDPTGKVVRLSHDIFAGETVASMSVAAHECGHAIQDKDNYVFFKMRSAIVPVVNFATSISYYVIMIGLAMQFLKLFYLGVALTAAGLVFQIVTLPVELDASRRAKKQLEEMGLVDSSEARGVKKMLKSAAMTYVAGVITSALQIFRLLLMARRSN